MTTLQTASMYASIAGAGASALGQYQQAQSAKSAAQYSAKVADIQAQDALDRGDQEQQKVGRQQSALRGAQTANMAAAGLDLSSGTPQALLEQTDYYGLEDQRTVVNNARREAAGYQSRSAMANATADGYNPAVSGASSLLTSGGQVADKWYKYNGKG